MVLVDDDSTDGTGRGGAAAAVAAARVVSEVIAGQPLPKGWTGKLWAVSQGVEAPRARRAGRSLCFTDADIAHAPAICAGWSPARGRQARAGLADGTLHCESPAERWLIPAFVFFFHMLFPSAG